MVNAGTDFLGSVTNRAALVFRSILRSEDTAYVVARYGGALLQAGEVLLISRLLGPVAYGVYAMWVQIAALMTIVGIGASWGFLLRHYRDPDKNLAGAYCIGAVAQFVAGGILAACLVYLYEAKWSWALLYFAAQIVPAVIEPVMRVSGKALQYVLMRGVAPVLTISLILSGGVEWFSDRWGASPALAALILVAVVNTLTGLVFIGEYRRSLAVDGGRACLRSVLRRILPMTRTYVREILPRGIPAGLTTVPYLINCNIDRFFLERYRPAEVLGGYALAWFLVQGGALCLHSINLLATTRIGAALGEAASLAGVIRRQVALVSVVFVAMLGLLIAASFVLQHVSHHGYTDLALLTAIVGVGHLSFGVAGVYISAAFFAGKTRPTMFVLCAAACLLLVGNVIVIACGWSYIIGLGISSMILLGSNAVLIIGGILAESSRKF